MKNCLFIVFLFSICQTAFSQAPHLQGTVFVSIKTGMIKCDLILSKIPALRDYAIRLNTGFNLAGISDSLQKVRYYKERYYDKKTDECFQYFLVNDNDTVEQLPKALRFQYSGAFPLFNDTSQIYESGDWKGNIAFSGLTARMTEQSYWYPVIYDKGKDVVLDNYTYSLKVMCEGGTSIYLNGDVPKGGSNNLFSSASPVPLLLFAGKYRFKQEKGTYFINSGLTTAETTLLTDWSDAMKSYYSSKLSIAYGSPIFYLYARAVTKKNVWFSVVYPTIMMTAGPITMHDIFQKKPPLAIDTTLFSFFAHEIAHYYFGSAFVPNSSLKWAFLEGFTEYMAMQFERERFGNLFYRQKLDKYISSVRNEKGLTSIIKVDEVIGASEFYKYRYIPLLLTALEKSIGTAKMWQWFSSILKTKDATTNYHFFKSSLLSLAMSYPEFQNFEERFITSPQALDNISEMVLQ